jgi:TldD protein
LEDIAVKAVEHARKLGAEFADIRAEKVTGTNIVVMDGKTKTVMSIVESGCGIRAFIGGGWGFAVTNNLGQVPVKKAAEAAVKMARASSAKAKVKFRIPDRKGIRRTEVYRCRERPSEVRVEDKLAFALEQDGHMRRTDPRIKSTNARYDDSEGERVVANSFGTVVRTMDTWTLGACSAWARSDGVMQRGHDAVGNVGGYELMRTEGALAMAEKAASMGLRLLDSKPPPAGNFTCVLDSKLTGLMAHEAFGHACEADAVLAGACVLEGKLGEVVADEQVSLIDDPTMKSTFGYFGYDWEGVKSSRHVLIEKGVLKGYMHNLETGARMGVPTNGAARSQAFSSPPIIRMSNTFIAPGEWKKDEIIEETKKGLLAVGAQNGYVEPAKGQFMFRCDEAYEIKDGEVGQMYRDASLSGVILEVLRNVECVADDLRLGDPGYCGKGGQLARTTDGGPHMCIKNIVVAGLA